MLQALYFCSGQRNKKHKMKMAAGHMALLCLSLILLATEVVSQRQCSVPVWPSTLGNNPINSNRGKVLLVAVLRGYCSYCVGQAQRLEQLKNSLASEGVTDISMLIINGGEMLSRRNIQNLINASNIPVRQDTRDNIMSRQVFIGNKDDFVIYDRCGQRAAYIPHPYSYLGHSVTRRVLRAVHGGRHSCQCSLDFARTNTDNVMLGDQPEGSSISVTENNLGLDCPNTDRMCRRYLRNYQRNNLEPSVGSQRARLPNRPRFRPVDRHDDDQQSQRNNRGRGNRHRRPQTGRDRIRNGVSA